MNVFDRILSPYKLGISCDFMRNFKPKSPLKQSNNKIFIIPSSNVNFGFLIVIPITKADLRDWNIVGVAKLQNECHERIYFFGINFIKGKVRFLSFHFLFFL